jgi:glutamate racemase
LEETIKLLPNENYIYYADSLNNPYGEKTDEEIFELVKT